MTKANIEKLVKKYYEEGSARRSIARKLSISRYMVDKILEINSNVVSVNKKNLTDDLKQYHNQIAEWLDIDRLPIKIIHERLLKKDVSISYSTVNRYINGLNKREVYIPVHSDPGQEAQVDYGYFGVFNKGNKKIKVWVFNMVLSYSRYAYYAIVTDQTTRSFLNCHTEAFEFFKGVPLSIKIDNLGTGVLEADFFEPLFQEKYTEFLDHYDTTAITARICRGQDKGKVEAGIKYVKNNFLKSITHSDYDQLCIDLAKWVKFECNHRIHGTTRKIPYEEYSKYEKNKLRDLPEERYKPVEFEERKVNTYGHIYFRKNYYSVPSHLTGETVLVETNGTSVKVYKNDEFITIHSLRHGEGGFSTQDNHKPYHKQFKSESYYIEQISQIGEKALRLLKLMQAEKPFHWKQMIRGVLNLSKVYSTNVIERACDKVVLLGPHTYKRVRHYCEKISVEPPEPKVMKGINGYAHDLSIYDRLIGTR